MDRKENISDQDRQLAREFERRLSGPLPTGNWDNPLIDSLNAFKESELTAEPGNMSSRKKNSWNQIKKNIDHSSNRKKTTFYKLGSIKHLGKIAAVITISAILSIYYFQIQSLQQPLAAADSTIETITLQDGSTVTLRPHSALFKKQADTQLHVYKLEGEAYFEVTKNSNREFIVTTDNGTVEVLGTEFNLRTWDETTDVYLKTGSLKISSSANKEMSVLLSPGEFSSLMEDQVISAPQKVEEELFTSWRNNEIIFINRRAESIFSELEHHYAISIIAPNDVNDEMLGGSISLESAKLSLQNLGTVLGGRFVPKENSTYEFIAFE